MPNLTARDAGILLFLLIASKFLRFNFYEVIHEMFHILNCRFWNDHSCGFWNDHNCGFWNDHSSLSLIFRIKRSYSYLGIRSIKFNLNLYSHLVAVIVGFSCARSNFVGLPFLFFRISRVFLKVFSVRRYCQCF